RRGSAAGSHGWGSDEPNAPSVVPRRAARIGLSRRRPRVRVPSLPLEEAAATGGVRALLLLFLALLLLGDRGRALLLRPLLALLLLVGGGRRSGWRDGRNHVTATRARLQLHGADVGAVGACRGGVQ